MKPQGKKEKGFIIMKINKINGLVLNTSDSTEAISDAIYILMRVRHAMSDIEATKLESANTGEVITMDMIYNAVGVLGGLRDAGTVWFAN